MTPTTKKSDLKKFIQFWLVPFGIIVAVFLLCQAATGLLIIGISIFLALALRPLVKSVDRMIMRITRSRKKHSTSSAVLAYLLAILILGAIIAIVGPVVVNETTKFVQSFPVTFEETIGGWDSVNNFGRSFGVDNLQVEIENFLSWAPNFLIGTAGENLVTGVSGVAGGIMKIILILVLTLLFLLEGPEMARAAWRSLEKNRGKESATVIQRLTTRMANVVSIFVSRQVLIAILDGCATIIIVCILSLIFGFATELAIPMGMITMLFYLIPMFGQFIGGTLVTLLLLFSNPFAALAFAIIYIVYAQFENNLISPKIQGNALNLRPVLVLSAIVIGMYMLGLFGAIIAVPVAGCIKVLIEEYPNIRAIRK